MEEDKCIQPEEMVYIERTEEVRYAVHGYMNGQLCVTYYFRTREDAKQGRWMLMYNELVNNFLDINIDVLRKYGSSLLDHYELTDGSNNTKVSLKPLRTLLDTHYAMLKKDPALLENTSPVKDMESLYEETRGFEIKYEVHEGPVYEIIMPSKGDDRPICENVLRKYSRRENNM